MTMLNIQMGLSDIRRDIAKIKKEAMTLNDSLTDAYRINWDSPFSVIGLEDKINVKTTIVGSVGDMTTVDITYDSNGVSYWVQHQFDTETGKCHTNNSLAIRNSVMELNL